MSEILDIATVALRRIPEVTDVWQEGDTILVMVDAPPFQDDRVRQQVYEAEGALLDQYWDRLGPFGFRLVNLREA